MAEVLTKAGVLLAIIALGYLLKRGGIFRRTDYEVVSKIVFRITLPCAVATAFFEGFEPNPTLFIVTLLGLLTGVLLWAGAFFSTRGRGEESRAFYTQNLPGYNIGAFTLPFVQSFVGSFGVVTACMFDVGNSLMCTGGNYALTSTLMGKTEGGRLKTFLRRLFSSVTIDTYLVLLVLGLLKEKAREEKEGEYRLWERCVNRLRFSTVSITAAREKRERWLSRSGGLPLLFCPPFSRLF